jgi:hypothetical protein
MSFRTSGRNSVPIDRRRLLSYLGAASLGLVAGPAITGRALTQVPRWTADPFSLGVASEDGQNSCSASQRNPGLAVPGLRCALHPGCNIQAVRSRLAIEASLTMALTPIKRF